ncbi:hypothetical protein BFP70_18040 [Thioclava sp. SK-1]|uniref:calcium-binding protein n=1 Tax=Thioclava sp. SK-1 TaxID=1889770 RepID=UPI0008256921|nr:calcium-binding protein [Thioclava sp. SK-1]OCX59999.1 hypothetical protein BFP70_18040 [Thioclava sp. SK-1]
MSNTSALNIINLQVVAEDQMTADKADGSYAANVASDAKYYFWQSSLQTIPIGMDGNPEQFAAKISEALPGVNTLRLPFNEFSFNADGTLHEQYERFLTAAAAEGFQIIFTYAGGDAQRFDDGGSGDADAIYTALDGHIYDGMEQGWSNLTAWLEAHTDVASAVYGFELANEPATYARGAGLDDLATSHRFVELYATHMAELSDLIGASLGGKFLVGGWSYSAGFDDLAKGDLGGLSALEYLRVSLGEDLVWASHLYPGWGDTDQATTTAELDAMLEAHYAILGDDDIILTETNANGAFADNVAEIDSAIFLFSRSHEWFAEAGIGAAWFPGVETGGSNFVVIDANGSLRYLHANSLGHGLNLFSLGEAPADHENDEAITTDIVAARLRNEAYQENPLGFDDVDGVGFGYGYGGNDTITGHDRIADFAYGGTGDDVIAGLGADDHLYGQYGADSLSGGDGHDHLFGGDGDDVLAGGLDNDQLNGGDGADLFVHTGGSDDITDYRHAEGDRLDLGQGALEFATLLSLGTVTDANGNGSQTDLVITTDSGQVTLYNFTVLNAADIAAAGSAVHGTGAADTLSGTAEDDVIIAGAGDDTLLAGAGNDTLQGGAGDDYLHSGKYGAQLEGGAGNDELLLIASKGGTHIASGGEGADVFRILGTSGSKIAKTTITDFTAAEDSIMIDGVDLATRLATGLADGSASLLQDGTDVVITFSPTQSLTLSDMQADALMSTLGLGPTQVTTLSVEDTLIDGWVDAKGIAATQGADLLTGTDVQDIIVAGSGDDVIHAGRGDDQVFGGSGNDLLTGSAGDDTLAGGTGNDTLTGNKGANVLIGDHGDDLIQSGLHGSSLDGGTGSDVLVFDLARGADHIGTGGADADMFQFDNTAGARTGSVTITDFELGVDQFRIDGTMGGEWLNDAVAAGTATITQVNGDTVVDDLIGGDRFVFQGITASDFEESLL